MARALLALGSNLGCPSENLYQAVKEISLFPGTNLLARSAWYSTNPVGGPAGQDGFLNASVLLETRLQPLELSHEMHNLEARMGRERRVRWDARFIDVDLLLYDNQIVSSDSLTVPHPRMTFRRFVLEPACEIAGAMVHPLSGWTLFQLASHLRQAPPVVAVVASDGTQADELASILKSRFQDELSLNTAALSQKREDLEITTTWHQRHENQRCTAGSDVGVVVAWDCNSRGQLEDECQVRDRISWNGPLAIVGGPSAEAVMPEVLAAIQAAWPEFTAAPPQSKDLN